MYISHLPWLHKEITPQDLKLRKIFMVKMNLREIQFSVLAM